MSRSSGSALISALLAIAAACADEEPALQQEGSSATAQDPAFSQPAASPMAPPSPVPLGSPSICEESAAQAAAELTAAVAGVDAACLVDADCTVAWPASSCYADCWLVVSQRGARQIAEAAEALGSSCATFEAHSCPPAVPSCDPLPAIACVAGGCRTLDEDSLSP